MQQFWSGKSYLRPDDGNLLSYDLAQRLIALIGQDHERLTRFVHLSNSQDGGSHAAMEVLGLSLGELTQEAIGARFIDPDAHLWHQEVEKGWF
jgi:hypothetical protein